MTATRARDVCVCTCAWRAVWRPVSGVGPVACVCARLLWAVVCLLPRSLLGGFCRGGWWWQPGVSGLLHPSPRWGFVRGVWWPVWPFRPPAVCSGACGAPPIPFFSAWRARQGCGTGAWSSALYKKAPRHVMLAPVLFSHMMLLTCSSYGVCLSFVWLATC